MTGLVFVVALTAKEIKRGEMFVPNISQKKKKKVSMHVITLTRIFFIKENKINPRPRHR